VERLPFPTTKSFIRSRGSEWSLTALRLGVSGITPGTSFLIACRRDTGNPEAICSRLGVERRERRRPTSVTGGFQSFLAFLSEREHDKSLARLAKLEVPFTQQRHQLLRHSLHAHTAGIRLRNQCATCHGEDLITRSRNAGEAGATPPSVARCVTGSVESLPPHRFSRGTRSSPRSTVPSPTFATHLAADTVNGARKAPFTVPFTAPFTLPTREALSDKEVVNCTSTQVEHRTGLERPHFVVTDTVVVAPALDAKESALALDAQRRGCNGVNVKSLHGFGEDGKNFILHGNLPNWLHLHHHSSKTLQERCKAPAAKSAGGKRTKTGGSDPTFSAPSRPKSFRGRSRPLILCNLH